MLKGIALDIDGTITHENRQVDLTAVKAIRKAEKSDLSVILATGNILCYAETTSVLLGTTGPLIAEDGGVVYDKENEEEYILGGLEKVNKGIKLLEEKFDNIQHTSSSDRRRTGRTLERTINTKDAIKAFKENNLNITAVDSGFAIHIKDPEVNKGKALEKTVSLLGCSLSEIAAMGDGENDIEMLKRVKHSFSPSNAAPKAKEASYYVTEGSRGKGVKEAIEKILENIN